MKSLLRGLVRLFPAPFREQFGSGMIADLERDYDNTRARGLVATAWFAFATTWDLARSIVAEHVSPTWVRPQPTIEEEMDMRWTGKGWLADIRFAVRTLRRSPGFSAVTIGTLGLAIGANAAMFGVVDAVLLKPLPYGNVGQLVHIAATAPGSELPDEFGAAAEFYIQYKEQSKLLEDVAVYNSFTNTVRLGDRVERFRISWPTSSLFKTLGAKPILGRLPVAEDRDGAVVLSHALWGMWFSRDPAVIGKPIEVGGGTKTIIGVMGPEFKFPMATVMLWIANDIEPTGITPGRFGAPLVARMKP